MFVNCPRCSRETNAQRRSAGRVRCQHCGNEWIPHKVTKLPARSIGKVVQCPNCSLQSSFTSQIDGQKHLCNSCGHKWNPSLPDSNKSQTEEVHRYHPIAFCSQCGRKVAEGAAFCSGCGHDLRESPETPRKIPKESYTLRCLRCGFEGEMSSPPLATDRVRCKNCRHEWYPYQKPSDRAVHGKEPFERETEGKKGWGRRTTHNSEPTNFPTSETRRVAESNQRAQLYGKVDRQERQPNVPTVPGGNNWCKWIIRGVLVGIPLLIVVSVCVAVVDDGEEPTRPAVTSTSRPVQRIAATATSRPPQRITATATSRPRPTATAINEDSHQRWLEGQEHRKNVNAFYNRWEQISADGVVDFNEYLQVCSLIPQWTNQLTAARDFVEEYRIVEPETFGENQGMFDAIKDEAGRGLEALAMAECE